MSPATLRSTLKASWRRWWGGGRTPQRSTVAPESVGRVGPMGRSLWALRLRSGGIDDREHGVSVIYGVASSRERKRA